MSREDDPALVLGVRLSCAAEQVLVTLARHRLSVLRLEAIRLQFDAIRKERGDI